VLPLIWRSIVIASLTACGAPTHLTPPPPPPPPAEERLLVFGDVQLAGPFKAESTLSAWKTGRLDPSDFAARFSEALNESKPTQILQTGDLVDLNESAVLDLHGTRVPQGWLEWAPMLALLPKDPKVYPVVGNHERYRSLVVTGALDTTRDHVEVEGVKLEKKASPAEVQEAMLAHFPHLRDGAEFHAKSGSYYVAFARYCLLSLDGADFDDDPSLFDFIDAKLGQCKAAHRTAVVSTHYPLFTGRNASEDGELELAKHRERLIGAFSRNGVALVFTGHEHFYLRYLDAGLTRAGFAKPSPLPIYVTVSDFGNPYSRKFERMNPDADVRYFRGTHYATVTFGEREVRVVAKGFDRQTGNWREIDAFSVFGAVNSK
jgi:hypothetical protein